MQNQKMIQVLLAETTFHIPSAKTIFQILYWAYNRMGASTTITGIYERNAALHSTPSVQIYAHAHGVLLHTRFWSDCNYFNKPV